MGPPDEPPANAPPAEAPIATPSDGVLSDEALMGRTRDGDEAAFKKLLQRHERRVVRFFAGRVHDRLQAEDLALEVWFKVFPL